MLLKAKKSLPPLGAFLIKQTFVYINIIYIRNYLLLFVWSQKYFLHTRRVKMCLCAGP